MFFTGNKTLQPRINEAVKIIDKITSGDFSVSIDASGSDAIAPLMMALKNNLVLQERRAAESRRETDANADLRMCHELTNKYLERMARGEIPKKITDEFPAEHLVFENNMNAIIDILIDSRRKDEDNHRVKVALDNVSTNIMIADNNRNIVYMNKSVGEMLTSAEQDVHKMLSNFNASRLLGSNIDQFHKDPAHQKGMLANFTATHSTQIQVGVRTFRLIANPIVNEQGERLGSVVEWADRTQEVAAEKDVNDLIEAAMAGELSKRLSLDGKVDFTYDIANKINQMLDAITQPLNTMGDYLQCISEGIMPERITDDYQGDYNIYKKNMNRTTNILKGFVDSVQYVINEQTKGDIDALLHADNFRGFYQLMAQGVNSLVTENIADNSKAMACTKSFGESNFDAALNKFPSKKAYLNDNIEEMRTHLKALIADTTLLYEACMDVYEACMDGNIQMRADTSKYKGDFRKIVEGINATMETIAAPIVAIKVTVDTINAATKEISARNADLLDRIERQAASLEETASDMEKLASTVKKNFDNAKQATQMAEAASQVAIKGNDIVRQVMNSMSAINEGTRNIIDIINVTEAIAFQTNILALNASVEAARAGENGLGFAIVASEARNLAQRSIMAAKEIKSLIGDSVEKAEDGRKLVNEARGTMGEIVVSVKRVADFMLEITHASAKQSYGIDQVKQAVTQMDEVTQQNAALVEKTATVAESLKEQTETLSKSVTQFRFEPSDRAASPVLSSLTVDTVKTYQQNDG